MNSKSQIILRFFQYIHKSWIFFGFKQPKYKNAQLQKSSYLFICCTWMFVPIRPMANVLSQLDPVYNMLSLVDNYVDTWVWPVNNVFTSGTKHKECIRNPFRTVTYSCET